MNRRQSILASVGFSKDHPLTRTEIKLAEIDVVIPKEELCAAIETANPPIPRALDDARSR